jgi:D-beta-D-heptose 7-phosphate kinase/D-beta-D-heptose 1-phosphate adenosyltransferase
VLEDPGKPTINKTRIIAQQQQILRIDREERRPLHPAVERELARFLRRAIPQVDGVICSDYGKGTLTAGLLDTLSTLAHKHGRPIIADPKGSDHAKYRGIDVLTPNLHELELLDGHRIAGEDDLRRVARRLIRSVGLKALVVTRGKDGMSVFERRRHDFHIPAQAREVFDVSGAGDTAVAFVALGLFAEMGLKEAAQIANKAAGIVVGKVGALPVSPSELLRELNESPVHTSQKIVRLSELKRLLGQARSQGRSIVFTNGCFDLLHVGHIRYFQLARRLGYLLVVGLNSDTSVRKIKGPKRPVIGEQERANILAALSDVDYVIIFPETTPRRLISALEPDILVKGGDYTPEAVVGRDIVERYGGRVEIVPYVGNVSTTESMQKIAERFH